MSTTSEFMLYHRRSYIHQISVPLEVFVCREVIEETFYKSKPFSKLRHVIITSAVIFTTMGRKSFFYEILRALLIQCP